MKSMIIYIDGKYLPDDQAKISVFDHGFLYGDGVFEGIRAYNGRVFRLKEHLDRLYDSAKTIDLQPPFSKEEMAEVICEVLQRERTNQRLYSPDYQPWRGRPWSGSTKMPETFSGRDCHKLGCDVLVTCTIKVSRQ